MLAAPAFSALFLTNSFLKYSVFGNFFPAQAQITTLSGPYGDSQGSFPLLSFLLSFLFLQTLVNRPVSVEAIEELCQGYSLACSKGPKSTMPQ